MRRAGLALALLGVAVPVFAVFATEGASVAHELQLFAPAAGVQGRAVAVRALIFDRLDEPDGPRFASMPVQVELRSGGTVVAQVTLGTARARGAEGTLRLDVGPGSYGLHAAAVRGGELLATAERPFEVVESPPPAGARARRFTELSSLWLGEPIALENTGDSLEASPLRAVAEARVVGGACVPEEPCDLLLALERDEVELEPSPSVAVEEITRLDAQTLRVRLRTHGPEAATRILLGGAAQPIQLPVALGVPSVRLEGDRWWQPPRPRLRVSVLTEGRGVLVDAFRDGVWERTVSFAGGELVEWPGEPLDPGTWVLQARTDPFPTERASPLTLVVGQPGGTPPSSAGSAWRAAERERLLLPLPVAASGLARDRGAVAARQGRLRLAMGLALALGLLIAALAFLRRGVGAAVEAQRVMQASLEATGGSLRPGQRRRIVLDALGLVALALLALLAGAVLLTVRAQVLQ